MWSQAPLHVLQYWPWNVHVQQLEPAQVFCLNEQVGLRASIAGEVEHRRACVMCGIQVPDTSNIIMYTHSMHSGTWQLHITCNFLMWNALNWAEGHFEMFGSGDYPILNPLLCTVHALVYSPCCDFRYNILSWLDEKSALEGVDTRTLFTQGGVEMFLKPRGPLFHSYINAYMDHGDCGRRNCSR